MMEAIIFRLIYFRSFRNMNARMIIMTPDDLTNGARSETFAPP